MSRLEDDQGAATIVHGVDKDSFSFKFMDEGENGFISIFSSI